MKGFKPTGYGPSAGFKFPSSYGFTGSTGAYTNVQPHVRHKPQPRVFRDGGYVSKVVGDPGSALVRRGRPYTEEDRESGGRSPLRPGFKDGGKNWIKGAIKHPGALHQALGVPEGKKIPSKKLNKAAHSDNPTMRRRANLAKTLKKMHKADGGPVTTPGFSAKRDSAKRRYYDLMDNRARIVSDTLAADIRRRSLREDAEDAWRDYTKARDDESWRHKSHGKQKASSSGPLSSIAREKFYADGGPVNADDQIKRNRLESLEAAGMLSDKDRAALDAMRKASKPKPPVKKADGGRIVRGSSAKPFLESLRDTPALVEAAVIDPLKRAMYTRQRTVEGRNESVGERAAHAESGKTMASNYSRGGKMKRMGYAKGGGVTAGEAKKIAERTVGEHVRYPAPKGHKGLGAMCKN